MSSLKLNSRLSSRIFYEDDDDENTNVNVTPGPASGSIRERWQINDSMSEIAQIAVLGASKVSLKYRSQNEIDEAKLAVSKELLPDSARIEAQIDYKEEPVDKLTQFKGLIFGVLSALGFCISQVLMKKSKYLSPTDHSAIRYIITLIIMVLITRYNKLKLLGPRNSFGLLCARGFIGCVSLISFYCAIMLLSPSDAVTLVHSSMIMTAIVSRIFLDEKLTIAHVVAILFTANGIIFISKPAAIFAGSQSESNLTSTVLSLNLNETSKNDMSSFELIKPLLGTSFALCSALGTSCVFFTLKKLTNKKVHWATSTIYVSFTGIPISCIISMCLYYYGAYHVDFKSEVKYLPMDLFYSSLASCMSILGQVFLNIAFKYEDATKIAITKTVDVFFSCVLQYLILDIKIDLFGVIGSCSILIGTFTILTFKLLENRYKQYKIKNAINENQKIAVKNSKKNLFLKCVFIKF